MPRDTVPEFTAAIIDRMTALGISQSDLARKAGCGQSAINGIVRGTRSPSLRLAAAIADALKIPAKLRDYAPENKSENQSE